MGCGGCAKRRERALRRKIVEAEPRPPAEPKLMCPACGVSHTQEEYAKCPFRLQLERQKAREARLKAKLAEKAPAQEVQAVNNRRGRQIYKQFTTPQVNVIPTRRKWQ